MKYHSNSREHQDFFVLSVLDGKTNGFYLEVGSAYPIQDNNTFLLENNFKWSGISIDNDEIFAKQFNQVRKNKCICVDATSIDYNKLLQNFSHIDYLQLDIDPPSNTFKVLQNIDFSKISFSVITYEHDFSSGGIQEREESRKILKSHGYTMVIDDVMHGDIIFEDWYVNEKYMPNDNWKKFSGSNIKLDKQCLDQRYFELFKEMI